MTQSSEVKIDKIDEELLSIKFSSCKYGENVSYLATSINGRTIYLHRLVSERIIGRSLLDNEVVDHINGNGLDNRRKNLRVCSRRENILNSTKRKNASSIFKGVSLYVKYGTWSAYICPNGKKIHLGYFETPELAAMCYNEAALKHYGKFARLNKIV